MVDCRRCPRSLAAIRIQTQRRRDLHEVFAATLRPRRALKRAPGRDGVEPSKERKATKLSIREILVQEITVPSSFFLSPSLDRLSPSLSLSLSRSTLSLSLSLSLFGEERETTGVIAAPRASTLSPHAHCKYGRRRGGRQREAPAQQAAGEISSREHSFRLRRFVISLSFLSLSLTSSLRL